MKCFPSALNHDRNSCALAALSCARSFFLGITILGLSSCAEATDWLRERKLSEAKASVSARPVGVTYDVVSSNEPHKQISVFFNGQSLARVLEPGDNWEMKTLLDYKNGKLIEKSFRTETQDINNIDPLKYPPVLTAMDAQRENAKCIGEGRSKGYAYHRWAGKAATGEWEVWTDDGDSFPIYYRSIKNGEVCTWSMVNSWIDGSTYNKPTFFTTEADPPPPEPEKTEEEKEPEREKEAEKEHAKKQHKSNSHSARKRPANSRPAH